VPLGNDKRTPKGNPRTVSIAFPKWFTLVMITQALGQMLGGATGDKKPAWFKTSNSQYYSIYYGGNVNQDAPILNAKCGAWVATAVIVPTNIDNPDDIPAVIGVVGSGGDRNG
jgi:hypothetical protein